MGSTEFLILTDHLCLESQKCKENAALHLQISAMTWTHVGLHSPTGSYLSVLASERMVETANVNAFDSRRVAPYKAGSGSADRRGRRACARAALDRLHYLHLEYLPDVFTLKQKRC
ncbi:hypothetical protein EVAR_19849_1 [Eumeta japonica]|uniref:Uncharacterized protein n=1 Tax=Eumeta variegata TaxID=151549 RepID=A0A4C1USL9_EUMVA|nr:hypothetical protein EVAR_19849_1 [Eumeta japonica]